MREAEGLQRRPLQPVEDGAQDSGQPGPTLRDVVEAGIHLRVDDKLGGQPGDQPAQASRGSLLRSHPPWGS